MQTTQRCPKCGQDKPADTKHFYYDTTLKSGLSSWCRECQRAANRERRARAAKKKALAAKGKIVSEEAKSVEKAEPAEKVEPVSETTKSVEKAEAVPVKAESTPEKTEPAPVKAESAPVVKAEPAPVKCKESSGGAEHRKLTLDFTDYELLFVDIELAAYEHMRTPEQQVMYMACKTLYQNRDTRIEEA